MHGAPLAVGFDLDYTLWDQEAFPRTFFSAIAGSLGRRLGCEASRVEAVLRDTLDRLTVGHPALFDAALHRLGVEDEELVLELVDRYHRHRPAMGLYPGARAALQGLRDRGRRLFLVTDGPGETQRYKVEALGIRSFFDALIFTGDLPRILHKPSPFPFLLACRRLGLRPSQCAFVGDNPLCDFEGPLRLGMRTVGVGTGPFAGLPVPPGEAPDLRVGSLLELEKLL
jgi:putative hydrolase of the HAD superfamily